MKKDIYIIRNTVNDKVYIGQTNNIYVRWGQHLSAARKHYPYLISQAMSEIGIDKFYYQILESQVANYDEREQYWIQYYNSITPNGYNITKGGKGNGKGIDNPVALFDSEEDVKVIIQMLQKTNLSMDNIAKQIGCSEWVISQINLGTTYHVDGVDYPIRKTRHDKELIKQIHYSLQYELDKSVNEISREYGVERSVVWDINRGILHRLPGKKYPLRKGRTFSKNAQYVEEIRDLLINSDLQQKDIARQFNVSCGFVSSVNKGSYYYDPNFNYPLRNNYQGNLSDRTCLSPDEVRDIEYDLSHTNKSIRTIAQEHEICYTTVMNINIGSIIKYYNPEIDYPIRKRP